MPAFQNIASFFSLSPTQKLKSTNKQCKLLSNFWWAGIHLWNKSRGKKTRNSINGIALKNLESSYKEQRQLYASSYWETDWANRSAYFLGNLGHYNAAKNAGGINIKMDQLGQPTQTNVTPYLSLSSPIKLAKGFLQLSAHIDIWKVDRAGQAFTSEAGLSQCTFMDGIYKSRGGVVKKFEKIWDKGTR